MTITEAAVIEDRRTWWDHQLPPEPAPAVDTQSYADMNEWWDATHSFDSERYDRIEAAQQVLFEAETYSWGF